ncbi:hypothetical protein Pryu01_02909 [Paraliobacillus ryukyuensis]|uniref:PilZ domain-containing protein n=1 Tax=Paraliobacillus ryukyuensis TaxID=200904 RepID=A0A366DZX4_9BACI|nr:PilZ domain-containing protein [Paraliobacillus ryukyuensis]RBO95415.1 PilZ domain-containing protein [Paraliobacillus ryukyuensis]
MRYKRQELLRFTFGKPITGTFNILIGNKNEEKKLQKSEAGELSIVDISPAGMRFNTKLDLPIANQNFLVEAQFSLANEPITMTGKIVWKKAQVKECQYGLQSIEDEEKEQRIISLLKKQRITHHKEEIENEDQNNGSSQMQPNEDEQQ